MEKKNKHFRVGFSTILWGVMLGLVCAAPCGALEVGSTETLNLDYPIVGDWVDVYGTLNMYSGAFVDRGIYAYAGSIVNIYAGTIGTDPIFDPYAITVFNGANVTVYGTSFALDSVPLEPIPDQVTFTGGSGTLTVTYDDDTTADLLFYSDIPINLAAPGEPPENEPPVANAGDDVTILSNELAFTVIQGTATDPDGDTLQYRWLEGAVEFTLWADVSENGEAPLDLGTILPEYLGVGTHTLTLEVTDGKDTVSDDMVLTIEIAPLTIDIKPGSYPNSINLDSHGVIPVAILSTADFDATTLKPENIFLAGSGVRVRGKRNKYLASEEDVNDDGLLDLVVKVETVNLDPDEFADGGAYLRVHETEEQTSLVLYEGWDEITIVPPKKGRSHGSRKKGRHR